MEKQLIPELRFPEFKFVYKNYILSDVLDLLTDFESNGSFASVKENVNIYDENNYAWYVRATDLENKTGLDKVKYVDEHSYKFLKKTPLFGNELLITKRGEIGKVYFFKSKKDVNATVAPNMYLLKLNSIVNSKYVYYSFINNNGNKKLKRINASTTIGALYKDDVKSIKVIFPKIEEQQKIASFLTDVDTKITQLTKKKTLLEQYKKGIMQKLFNQELRFKDDEGNSFPDWEEKKLGSITKYYDGTHQTPNYVSEGVPFYSVEHVTADQFEKTKFITEEVFEKESKRVELEKGDILMTRIGNVGKAKYIDWDVRASFYVSLALIKQNATFSSKYLSQFINATPFQRELWKRIIHVAFPIKINLGEIGKCIVTLPCIDEQTKIANFLSDIDVKIEALTVKIENSQSFKKGLLQKMFV